MLLQLSDATKVVGIKQSRKVIRDGAAKSVFIAKDAEKRVTGPIYELCQSMDVAVNEVDTMQELGSAVGIAVGAAVVTVVND